MILFDANNPSSFKFAQNWFSEVVDTVSNETKIAMVANKIDLEYKVEHNKVQQFVLNNKIN